MSAEPSGEHPGQASPWEWLRLFLLMATLGWTVACLGGYRPETLLVTGLGIIALVLVHCLAPSPRSRVDTVVLLALPFLGYAALNACFLSPVPWLGWQDWFNWALMAAVFWVAATGIVSDGPRRWGLAILGAITAASSLLGCYQHWVRPDWMMLHRVQSEQFIGRSSGSFGIPNSLAALCALVMPAIGWRMVRGEGGRLTRGLWAAAGLVVTLGFVLTVSRGAWLSLALALAAWPLLLKSGSLWRRLAWTGAVIASLALVVAILVAAMPLVRQRLLYLIRDAGELSRPILWRAALHISAEHPWVGGGAGAFNILFERWRPEGFNLEPRWAHNDYLNTLCDYGIIGVVLGMAPVVLLAMRLRRSRALEAALCVGLMAFALQLSVDFNLKLPGLAMSACLVAALALAPQPRKEAVARPGRVGFAGLLAIALGVGILGLGLWLPGQRAESIRFHTREEVDQWAVQGGEAAQRKEAIARWIMSLEKASALSPRNAKLWSDLAYVRSFEALVVPGRTGEIGKIAENDARKALKLSSIVPEFWDHLGTTLDMQQRWVEGGDAVVKALVLAPASVDCWYYYGYHLSLAPSSREEALAALDTCLRLDPGFGPAQTLRQRLAITR